jgi:hypothetical protein
MPIVKPRVGLLQRLLMPIVISVSNSNLQNREIDIRMVRAALAT